MSTAIILAAGSSSRFKHHISKLFMQFGNQLIIEKIIDRFLHHEAIKHIILVHNDDENFKQTKTKYQNQITFVKGGDTRQNSVQNALANIKDSKKILIHDAARFNCSNELITKTLEKLDEHDAVIPIIPAIDTIKLLDLENGQISSTLDRDKIGLAQTPQGFNSKLILKLHQKAKATTYTDDASLCEALNIPVHFIYGEKTNFKITEFEDFQMAERLFHQYEYLYANGYDLHKFSETIGDFSIILGGITIPHKQELVAHSDGDVLLHSLTDAVLGLCSGSDIGELFPDNKIENKNRNSLDFIEKAIKIAEHNNIKVTHIDVTIILELPKLSPYKNLIQKNIAKIFNLHQEHVNIKATTNEKIGDIGSGKAIAVLSTVTGKKHV